jgi:3,4-dihydroxy 2-butanone 4-phosphate synthase/GTP cyclohydrolase II
MEEIRADFASVEEAVEEIRQGRMIVLVDDEDRENEGDLAMAAEKITPEAINFMAKYARGLICLPLTEERCDELRLPLMSPINTSVHGTAFCEAIDGKLGVTTGISASDRAITILTAVDPKTKPQDLARPGHIFPLRARNGGVLVRAGQTEASVDLARIAGLTPAGVICEIMNDDGSMARVPDLIEFCTAHRLKMLTVAELIRYRMAHERVIHRQSSDVLQTEFGEFVSIVYKSDIDEERHVALVHGDLGSSREPIIVRMQARCLGGDVFHSSSCECASNMRGSMQRIVDAGSGVVVYLHQNSPGFALESANGINCLESHRDDKVRHSLEYQRCVQREVGLGAQILLDLNIRRVILMTSRSRPGVSLAQHGIEVVEQVPIMSFQTYGFDCREPEEVVSKSAIVAHA